MSGLAARAGETLVRLGLRVAVAESCTGGMLAAELTANAGASAYFAAGVVSYSDESKHDLLGVSPATIAAYGAVSEHVAREMLDGIRARAGADAALAVTGVAGPGGGTADKPVGTVWIGAAAGESRILAPHQFQGDRAAVRQQSVDAALLLLERVLEHPS